MSVISENKRSCKELIEIPLSKIPLSKTAYQASVSEHKIFISIHHNSKKILEKINDAVTE